MDVGVGGQVETTLIPSSRVLSLFYGPSDTCFARYLVGGRGGRKGVTFRSPESHFGDRLRSRARPSEQPFSLMAPDYTDDLASGGLILFAWRTRRQMNVVRFARIPVDVVDEERRRGMPICRPNLRQSSISDQRTSPRRIFRQGSPFLPRSPTLI